MAEQPETTSGKKTLPKQAVVVVHGMGEQRPLETLRSFVDGVYSENPSLAGEQDIRLDALKNRPEDDPAPSANLVWIVPDDATGSAELRRISTPLNSAGIRTDFYEFYWADVMEGTPLELVLDWVQGLLLRSPANVPPRLRVILAWLMLWVVALVTVALAIFGVAPNSEVFAPLTNVLGHFFTDNRWWVAIGLALIGGVVLLLRLSSARRLRDVKLTTPVVALLLAAAAAFAPNGVFNQPTLWAWLVTFLGASFFTKLVAPYVGDVARYARATPATVEKRGIIRARGLDLLDRIHAKVGPDGLPEYDRVVLVGHSLGCFVAYDLLLQYWAQKGPSHRSKVAGKQWTPESDVAAALGAIDGFTQKVWPEPACAPGLNSDQLQGHREAQTQAFTALARSAIRWRISDFITLGSPLGHADFLLVDGADALEQALGERLFAASPPRPDWPNKGMLYRDWAGLLAGKFPHFAAPFAAIKWTNIYDEHWFPLIGDIVSGRLPACFGPGIEQVPVAIKRAGRPWLLNRIFTHTLYWSWQKGYESPSPPHILALRKALDLAGPAATHSRAGRTPIAPAA